MMIPLFFRRTRRALCLSAAAALAVCMAHPAAAATNEELEAKLQQLATQVQALQTEVAALRAQNGGATQARVAQNAQPAAPAAASAPASTAANARNERPNLEWFGYG